MTKFVFLHSPQDRIQIEPVVDRFVPPGSAYFLSQDQEPKAFIKTIHEIERERDRYRERYENVLRGLEYWKARATS